MKRTNIPYNEARQLLLQGIEMKLPKWKGYWKFDTETKTIEAHLKDGNTAPARAEYTLHDNWEMATVENCPVLKEELEVKTLIQSGEITDIKPTLIDGEPDLAIFIETDDDDTITVVNINTLTKLFGRKETDEMLVNHLLGKIPEDMQDNFKEFMSDVDNLFKDLHKAVEKHMK